MKKNYQSTPGKNSLQPPERLTDLSTFVHHGLSFIRARVNRRDCQYNNYGSRNPVVLRPDILLLICWARHRKGLREWTIPKDGWHIQKSSSEHPKCQWLDEGHNMASMLRLEAFNPAAAILNSRITINVSAAYPQNCNNSERAHMRSWSE